MSREIDRPIIDLRSDTVTKPTAPMRRVMAEAEVGDDQFGEDPSIQRLQRQVALILGKEEALWLPTGTMANQVALRALTRPGDDVIVSAESHAVWHETGASAANAGVQFTPVGRQGVFNVADVEQALKPRGHVVYPPTTLIEIENTHNRAGGVIFPQSEAVQICELARERHVATYLDGARLWNASVASGLSMSDLAAGFDLVSVSLSKGLGAPGGALLAGQSEVIQQCVRFRRMSGGAMRQVGIFAVAGSYAIEHHVDDLANDHRHARAIADRLSLSKAYYVDPATVSTNIVIVQTAPQAPSAPSIVDRARGHGVLVFAFGPRTLRIVTHRDVSEADCALAAEILVEVGEHAIR